MQTGLAESLLLDAHGSELLGGGGHIDKRSQTYCSLTGAARGHVGRRGFGNVETIIAREDGVGTSHEGWRKDKIGGEEARVEVGAIRGAREGPEGLERS